MILKTVYDVASIPHSEYPRPQFARQSYLCLNGEWDFSVVDKNGKCISDYNKILVPFSPESVNSGIGQKVLFNADDRLYYKKQVQLNHAWENGVTILHFGAVDYACEVYVNSCKVGEHEGGFTSFSFNVSPYVKAGLNMIEVFVFDDTENHGGGRGKQSKKPGGIWYTAQSGIWQTVWMENLPKKHISSVEYYPDVEKSQVVVKINAPQTVEYKVFDGNNLILQGQASELLTLQYPFELWSPENPKLYDIEFVCGDDKVKSYFAMRSFGITTDKKGIKRLSLNGKPYFFSGLLDQGYWPDGLLTYPSDQAILDELTLLKKMGFNTLRKHIKVEPMRWYYYCDKLGFIVWQDFVNGGGDYKFTNVALFPFLGFKHRDNDYKYFARKDEKGRELFVKEWKETISQLKNCVCISLWTVFNEGWGQFDSNEMQQEVEKFDSTRVIESISGWHDYKKQCKIRSMHTYYTRLKVPKENRVVTLSEFGGYSLKIDGHVFNDDKFFGYKKFKKIDDFVSALKKLYLKKLKPLIAKGLSAAIYTQVSDVEEEINGLITYDRKICKISCEEMKALNDALYEEAKNC